MKETDNFYELLEVDPSASANEIKKAYVRKIRLYSNETHPEEFKVLTKAYQTLSDPEKRDNYDREVSDSGAYNKLFQLVNDEMNRNSYARALQLLDEMEKRYPDDLVVKQHIAICFIELQRYEDARRILVKLHSTYPEEELNLQLLVRVSLDQQRFNDAKSYLKRLILLNPKDSNYYLRLSNTHFQLNEYDEAMEILEKKMRNQQVTAQDYPLLIELYFLTLITEKYDYHNRTVKRIKQTPSNSQEKNILLNMLMDECFKIGPDHFAYKELVGMVRDINQYEDQNITNWVNDAESRLNPNIYYYDEYGNSQPQRHQRQQSQPYEHQPYNSTSSSNGNVQIEERGSLLVSIIIGIIVSIAFTPFIGIPAGFVWYFYASNIKALLNCLGCIFLILVAFGIIAMLFGF